MHSLCNCPPSIRGSFSSSHLRSCPRKHALPTCPPLAHDATVYVLTRWLWVLWASRRSGSTQQLCSVRLISRSITCARFVLASTGQNPFLLKAETPLPVWTTLHPSAVGEQLVGLLPPFGLNAFVRVLNVFHKCVPVLQMLVAMGPPCPVCACRCECKCVHVHV